MHAESKNNIHGLLGLIQINGQCSDHDVEGITSKRLSSTGWKLLQIVTASGNIDTKKMESDLGDYLFLKVFPIVTMFPWENLPVIFFLRPPCTSRSRQ